MGFLYKMHGAGAKMSGRSARGQGTVEDSLAAGLLGLRALGLVCPLRWDWPLLQGGQRVRGGTPPPLPAQRPGMGGFTRELVGGGCCEC